MISKEKINKIEDICKDYDGTHKPGFVLGVFQNGEIIFQNGYGMANLNHDIPITPETVFRIGSVSKQFCAFAVALLEVDGKIGY